MKKAKLSRLSVKLIILITAVLLVNLFIYTVVTVRDLKQQITSALVQNAYAMSDIIKKSSRYSMLQNRREDIFQTIKTVGSEKGVFKIRIYNKFGNISYSSDTTEINRTIDMNSEACNVCHSEGKIINKLPPEKLTRFYTAENNISVLGCINPIYNEPDCSDAGCHFHPKEKAILGVLDIIITTEKIDALVDANIRNIITGSILITILIALFSGFGITIVINSPMRKITKGIGELAAGNLSYRIDLNSRDELGEMAAQFNEMSARLDAAYQEIKNWNETLNSKVKDKNEELKKIYEQVVNVEKLASLGKLSATVAHELNNPLEGILTYSKLISKMLSRQNSMGQFDPILQHLTLIADESSRCGRIVKDLLLFSHSDAIPYQRHDLREITDKALAIIHHHLEIHQIRLDKLMDSTEVPVMIDSQKIEQALLTIIMNAIESMPNGGKLSIVVSKDGNEASILVKDEGPGISEKDLANIFDPFFTTKVDKKGTGLGLSVCYGIITQHKGIINVAETSPRGTTFRVSLPLHTRKDNL